MATKHILQAGLALSVSGLALMAAARAQTAAPPSGGATVNLEEITVTARKREESVKDVPFGVTVVGREQLENQRIERIEDAVRNSPNVNTIDFGDGNRNTFFSIRGVGPVSSPLSPEDTSVVVNVDGVPRTPFTADVGLFDLERVEVLKGPQGTLFGRNSVAGAINVVTRKPTDEKEVTIGSEIGSDLHRRVNAVVSGPIIPGTLYMRVAASYSGIDGFILNSLTGEEINKFDRGGGRATMVYKPQAGTELTLTLTGERNHNENATLISRRDPFFPRVSLSFPGKINRDVAGANAELKHDLGFATLTAVSSITFLDYSFNTDNVDGAIFGPIFGLPETAFVPLTDTSFWKERERAINQEVRLNSLPGSFITWVTGLNFFRSDFNLNYDDASLYFGPFLNGRRRQELSTTSYAAFGEATVPLWNSGFKLTGGLRATHEMKELDLTYRSNGAPGTVPFFADLGERDYDFLTGRASLSYDWSPEVTSYGTISRGYKTGGFPRYATGAALGLETPTFKSAEGWTYEIGTKSVLLDGRARFDLALFYNDIKNEQVFSVRPPLILEYLNVDTKSYGAEVQGAYKLTDAFEITGNLGLTRATIVNLDAETLAATGARNGNRVPNVPAVTAGLGLNYAGLAGAFGLPASARPFGNVTWQFVGAREADIQNSFRLDAYHNLGARLGLEFDNGFGTERRFNSKVYVFGQNLLDQNFETFGVLYSADPRVEAVSISRGRVVGLGAQVTF